MDPKSSRSRLALPCQGRLHSWQMFVVLRGDIASTRVQSLRQDRIDFVEAWFRRPFLDLPNFDFDLAPIWQTHFFGRTKYTIFVHRMNRLSHDIFSWAVRRESPEIPRIRTYIYVISSRIGCA